MQVIKRVARNIWIGVAFSVFAIVAGLAAEAVWGQMYDRYDWRVIALAILILGIMLIALAEELLRPQNPYKHLDPRFSFLDAGPTGKVHGSSTNLLWNMIPPALVCVLLIVTLTR